MDNFELFPFGVGLLLGFVVGWLVVRYLTQLKSVLPDWSITHACLREDGSVQIELALPGSSPGVTLLGFHSHVEEDEPGSLPETPGSGAAMHGHSSSTLIHPPPGTTAPPDCVIVWAEFRVFVPRALTLTLAPCSESGSSMIFGPAQTMSPALAEQLEAVPRVYRVSVDPSVPGGRGALAELFGGTEAAEPVLHYVPERSTPTDPCWRARGGPGPVQEWTLTLLRRRDGFGATLIAVCLLDGREVRLSWVTSNWNFNAANRFTGESEEANGLLLVVGPA